MNTKHRTGTRKEWLAARLELLEAEKELTRQSDELARRRQELPWVRMIAGTEIGDRSAKMYAAKAGISQEKFMERFGKPLTPPMVAEGILTIARGEGPAGPAIAITGNSGLEAMEAILR